MTTTPTLAGRTACVTGASSGMGRSIAEHLGALGVHVFLAGRTTDEMVASAGRIASAGGRAEVDTFDLTDLDRLRAWIDGAATSTGRLDVLVNSAGFGDFGSIVGGDPQVWRGMLEVNVLAVAVGCQAAVGAMRRTGSHGNIINVSSTATLRRDSGFYGATKYAVNCINSTLRQELEDDTIRVTALIPGVFASNFSRHGDPSRIVARADAAGLTDLRLDDSFRLTPDQIVRIQAALPTTLGDTTHIARAVEYVVSLPIELNVEELVIRPQKSLF
ncbi:MAG: SDR family NAD(P)-dependent oxidoreductase [Actinomycetota bacterium]